MIDDRCWGSGARLPLTVVTFIGHMSLLPYRGSGVAYQDFQGEQTDEPSVIGWMPSAQLYFRDPDGHSVEFIALLDGTPDPSLIGPFSEWRKKT